MIVASIGFVTGLFHHGRMPDRKKLTLVENNTFVENGETDEL